MALPSRIYKDVLLPILGM
jgi:hypothetical protein